MTYRPFLTFRIYGKRDVLQARHRGRQIAALLHFSVTEQACIAAGTFAVACHALRLLGKFLLCFALEGSRLHVYARAVSGSSEKQTRVIGPGVTLVSTDRGALLHMVKILPPERRVAEGDLAWLVHNGDHSQSGVFEEVVKQNQEMLAVLHELYALQRRYRAEEMVQPSAA
jgi:hypothetical protein